MKFKRKTLDEFETNKRETKMAKEKYSTFTVKERYLGDGLYVSIDPMGIKLRAPRENGDHWVIINVCVYRELRRFADEIKFDPKFGLK